MDANHCGWRMRIWQVAPRASKFQEKVPLVSFLIYSCILPGNFLLWLELMQNSLFTLFLSLSLLQSFCFHKFSFNSLQDSPHILSLHLSFPTLLLSLSSLPLPLSLSPEVSSCFICESHFMNYWALETQQGVNSTFSGKKKQNKKRRRLKKKVFSWFQMIRYNSRTTSVKCRLIRELFFFFKQCPPKTNPFGAYLVCSQIAQK